MKKAIRTRFELDILILASFRREPFRVYAARVLEIWHSGTNSRVSRGFIPRSKYHIFAAPHVYLSTLAIWAHQLFLMDFLTNKRDEKGA